VRCESNRRIALLALAVLALPIALLPSPSDDRPPRVRIEPASRTVALRAALAASGGSATSATPPARVEVAQTAAADPPFLTVGVADELGAGLPGLPLLLWVELEDGTIDELGYATVDPSGRRATFAVRPRSWQIGRRDVYLGAFDYDSMRPRLVAPHELAAGRLEFTVPAFGAVELPLDPRFRRRARPDQAPREYAARVAWRHPDGFARVHRSPAVIADAFVRVLEVPARAFVEIDASRLPVAGRLWSGSGPSRHGEIVQFASPSQHRSFYLLSRTPARCGGAHARAAWRRGDGAEPPSIPPTPLHVHGIAVDDLGLPVASATVQLSVGGSGRTLARMTTDLHGRFESKCMADRSRIEVDVRCVGYPSATVTLELPSDGLPIERESTLRLHGDLTIPAMLLLDDWVDPAAIRWQLPAAVRCYDQDPAESGTALVQPLVLDAREPCRDTLRLFAGADAEPLLSFEQVEFHRSRSSFDPRLHPIDLRGRIRRLTLAVVDDRGMPVWNASFTLHRESWFAYRVETRLGRLSFLTAQPCVAGLLDAPGHEPRELSNVGAGGTVWLRRAD
jgi:hypothetical protein